VVLCCCNVSELVKFFGLSFSALLPLVNPVGDALVFLALVGTARPVVYRSLAKKIAISTTLFLVMIEVLGTAMLKFFGISLPVMQVSGGLALAAMGWRMLNQEQPDTKDERTEVRDAGLGSLEGKIFYPFTFPITAGPGCIVVMVTLSAHASVKGLLPTMAAHAGIVLAVVLLSVAVYFCYGYAPAITARVSSQTAHGILRVIAFVLLCIGGQITWNGVEALLKTVLKS
jgi:multiple antibiotic resistance protein